MLSDALAMLSTASALFQNVVGSVRRPLRDRPRVRPLVKALLWPQPALCPTASGEGAGQPLECGAAGLAAHRER
jgi:hypothetical protein